MRRAIHAASFSTILLFATFFTISTSHAEAPSYGLPSKVDPSARYLFYFHNYYVENKGPDGDTKYYDILKTFTDKGFTVISEIRPKDASVIEYAKKGAVNVQKLLDAGVPQDNVTVAGHSKGGVIALQVASVLEKPMVSYVIMAGCGIKSLEKAYPDFTRLTGNFFSLYATSDKVAESCRPYISLSKHPGKRKELALESPAGHQLFFKPVDAWVEPVVEWMKNKGE